MNEHIYMHNGQEESFSFYCDNNNGAKIKNNNKSTTKQ